LGSERRFKGCPDVRRRDPGSLAERRARRLDKRMRRRNRRIAIRLEERRRRRNSKTSGGEKEEEKQQNSKTSGREEDSRTSGLYPLPKWNQHEAALQMWPRTNNSSEDN
jgi:hypothetical protein